MPNKRIVGCVEGSCRHKKKTMVPKRYFIELCHKKEGLLYHLCIRLRQCSLYHKHSVTVLISSTHFLGFVWPVCLRGYKKVRSNMKSRCDEQSGTFNFKALFGYSTNTLFREQHMKFQSQEGTALLILYCVQCIIHTLAIV